nr:DNA-directed RNA polymerase subunit beta [bacterium]
MHDVKMGLRTRKSFSRIQEVLDMPNLIEVQRNSYKRFLEHDLREVLDDVSPITDYSENWQLVFLDYRLDDKAKYTIEECRDRDMTYAVPLRVRVQLINCATGEKKEQEVFMGDFPLMTPEGTFVINGADRVIVSQLVRSPGVYFNQERDKSGKQLFSAQVIPNRGAWLEYEADSNDCIWVRVDRTRKLPVTTLLRALGDGSNAAILERMGESEALLATLERDDADSEEKGLLEIYKRLRPGEPPTVESARSLLGSLFFDSKRYDLARVGRYKFNKKLALSKRLDGLKAAEMVVCTRTGEVLAQPGQVIDRELALKIQNSGVSAVWVELEGGRKFKVLGNNFVDPTEWLPISPEEAGLPDLVYLPVLKRVLERAGEDTEALKAALQDSLPDLSPKWILSDDVFASVNYQLGLPYGIGELDDIDHLGNRRLRSVGELLQNQIRIGLTRLERVVKERMAIQDMESMKPSDLINVRPVTAAIKEFFGSSQLSQFMDHPNPLAEITHKRRLSALGPGGLNRDRASFEVRDVHHSHYGRICPIETPEGPNIGLIGSLSIYARVNEYGFIESPYRVVDKENHRVTDTVVYMTADEEEPCVVAQANEKLDENGWFASERVMVRVRDDITEMPRDTVDLMDVSPRQLVSVATGMIPFLENDDPSRALMGANMQRQGVPLLVPQAPRIGTGMEYKAAHDSGVVQLSPEDGVIEKVAADQIVLRGDSGKVYTFKLRKFNRSNQGTCINQRPLVSQGQRVHKDDSLCDGPSTDHGEIALGRNVLIAFMVWEGYNYEDAILINEKLVREDAFTSIHIEEYECEARDTKLGPEEITRDIPNVGDALRDLDERGIVRVGAEVHAGDIL